MAVAFVGGAALGAAFGELLHAVREFSETTANFKPALKRLERTLSNIEPTILKIVELDRQLERIPEDSNMLKLLNRGQKLVIDCSNVRWLNVLSRYRYSIKLKELDDSLLRFFQIDEQAQISRDNREILLLLKEIRSSSMNRRILRSCSVPGPPTLVVGFVEPLEVLKKMVLQTDDASPPVVVLLGHGGQGKTTLAKMLCHDSQINERFGDNVFFARFTENPNLDVIVHNLVRDMGYPVSYEFSNVEDAIDELDKCVRLIGADHILLVLDDVWSESENLIEKFEFSVKGLKILVTSRSRFPKYEKNTYELKLLNEKDSMELFGKVVFPNGGHPNMPEELMRKRVNGCRGFPLALIVDASYLRRVPMSEWSNYDSNEGPFHCLQPSVDALDKLPDNIKDCYQDLALFPADERIPVASLGDMWAVLYGIDLGKTLRNLSELSHRNLADLTSTRRDNDISTTEISSDEHHVTQHDVVREVAIRQSNQELLHERVRLNVDIRRENPSSWPIDQPLNARIMSFSTDETSEPGNTNHWAPWFAIWVLPMFRSFGSLLNHKYLQFPKLEALVLNLRSKNYAFPHFMTGMTKLKVLIVTNYGFYPTELQDLRVPCSLPNLQTIRLVHVSISSFDSPFKKMQNLRKISLRTCKIDKFFQNYPHKIPISLPNLVEIEIDHCYELERLPLGLCDLDQITKLTIANCHELIELPDKLGKLSNLEELRLHSCTKLSKLPESIGDLCKLSFIDVSDCIELEELPKRMGELDGLRKLNISGCTGLKTSPESLQGLRDLEVVCDEELSCVWNTFDTYVTDMKVKVVQRENSLNRLGF